MDTVATWFGYGKPDPRQQRQKFRKLIRDQRRSLEELKRNAATTEKTITKNIQQAHRDLRNPTTAGTAAQARSNLRFYGRKMVEHRQENNRIAQAFAQLASLEMSLDRVMSVQKMQNALGAGTSVMKALNESRRNTLLANGLQELQTELIKSDVIQGLVEETLSQTDPIEEPAVQDVIDEITEAQIDNAIASALNQSLPARKVRTPALGAQEPVVEAPQEKPDEEKQDEGETAEALLEDMNHRLQALRS